MARLSSPLFSVIIPSYGRPELLGKCVEKLRRQTYEDMEIIVVHDGPGRPSYDSEDILVSHRDEPRGSPAAKNRGIELASGEVLAFLDDDSIPASEEWAREYIDAFRRFGRDVGAIGGYIDESQPFDTDGGPGRIDRRWPGFYRIVSAFQADEAQEVEHLKSCNFAVRTDVFDVLDKPYFDPRFKGNAHREETDFTLRIRAAGYRLFYTPDCRVCHEQAESGGQRASVSGGLRSAYWSGYNEALLYYNHFHQGWLSVLLFIIQEALHNRLLPWRHPGKVVGLFRGLYDHGATAVQTGRQSEVD